MITLEKEKYIEAVGQLLIQENIEPHLTLQILETVRELLDYYSVDFVSDFLPTLFKP
ncbi:hypothetical protein P7D31_12100 [Enterococcus dongliensis]|uniref:hypothetical protein n=1 Tax=Enterococcus dongliensis TaxID=2559925 RepID=UPI00288CFE9B|nr:hypothetical protein [Enterococcus dongliensis]MDT2640851.1 hypothetical protein [Enterococcus dongliensis]